MRISYNKLWNLVKQNKMKKSPGKHSPSRMIRPLPNRRMKRIKMIVNKNSALYRVIQSALSICCHCEATPPFPKGGARRAEGCRGNFNG